MLSCPVAVKDLHVVWLSVATACQRTVDASSAEEDLVALEAVLHPDPDTSTVIEHASASPNVLARYAALMESVGGQANTEWNDVADWRTFAAIDIRTTAAAAGAA